MRAPCGDSVLQQINPDNYQQQLDIKLANLNSDFAEFSLPKIDIHTSEPLHFRMRAEFRIWHENGSAHYAMNQPGEKRPYIIDDFPIGSQQINQLMPKLLVKINTSEVLSRRLFSAEFLTTLSGEALITLIYHKPLNEEWQESALQLQQQLGVAIIGRSRKQKKRSRPRLRDRKTADIWKGIQLSASGNRVYSTQREGESEDAWLGARTKHSMQWRLG